MLFRSLNEITHFTHYTVAHAHLGVYSFYTMILFGAIYYILPRLTGREWISARLIKLHFWTTAVGMIVYWVGLTLGGVLQGLSLNDPNVPFLDIVADTIPFLVSRSFAGILMTVGHLAFFWLIAAQVMGFGKRSGGPTLLAPLPSEPTPATNATTWTNPEHERRPASSFASTDRDADQDAAGPVPASTSYAT